jgi:hypothetical protein
MFSHHKTGEQKWNRFCQETTWQGEEVAQILYTYVSNCKNDEIKFKKKGKTKKHIQLLRVKIHLKMNCWCDIQK